MPKENDFAAWLREALAGRPNVYLVRNSGTKENGRPVIDDSRVSKWLKGEQRPSMELASLAARVLGKPQSAALRAAGYTYGTTLQSIERMEKEYPTPRRGVLLTFDQIERLSDIHQGLGELLAELEQEEGDDDGTTTSTQKIGHDDQLRRRRQQRDLLPGDDPATPVEVQSIEESSAGDETVLPAADRVDEDEDEEPGGSDDRG